MKIQIDLDTLDEVAELVAIIRGERAVHPDVLRAVTEDLAQSTTDLDEAVKAAHLHALSTGD